VKKFKYSILVLCIAYTASCKKRKTEASENIESKLSQVNGRWVSPCISSGQEGSQKNFFEFQGHQFSKETIYFEKKDCRDKNTSETIRGNISVKSIHGLSDNRMALNLSVISHDYTIHNETVVKYFNDAKVDNKSDWKVNKPEPIWESKDKNPGNLAGKNTLVCLEVVSNVLRNGFLSGQDKEKGKKCRMTHDLLQREQHTTAQLR